MSRSYKKNNITTDHRAKTTKYWKRQANKKVRHSLLNILLNGGVFKKLFDQYNLCDYRFQNDDPKYLRK